MVGLSPGLVKSNLALSVVDGWFEPWSGLVKSNTIKCVFAASWLSTLHKGEGPNTGWQCVPVELAL